MPKIFPVVFGIVFAGMAIMMLGMFAISAWLGYDCYRSGDPNSMACYMMSERHEVAIRQRQ